MKFLSFYDGLKYIQANTHMIAQIHRSEIQHFKLAVPPNWALWIYV